jgi:tetratricopeptide (TPR) repeat protein
MPCRNYCWLLIAIHLACAPFFQRRSEFEKGLEYYRKADYNNAVNHFVRHYNTYPGSDTTLYYLYDCYKRLDKQEPGVRVLEQLVRLHTTDKDVYLTLFDYYHTTSRYRELSTLLTTLNHPLNDTLNKRYVLTRRLYAEIVSGATTSSVPNDPLDFAITQGYIPEYPDGSYGADDTITTGNLIILLDRLVEPIYPINFYTMRHISDHSYLYLPYMRLVHLGIMDFDAELDPDTYAGITAAAVALTTIVKKGLLD